MPFAPTTMTYGSYSFRPVPVVSIRRSFQQVKNRQLPIGFTFQIVLTGTLTPIPDQDGGLLAIDTLIDELRSAFSRDGMLFELMCGNSIVLQTYPRIIGEIEFGQSDNQWVFTVPYTITLEYDTDDAFEDQSLEIPPYIEDYQESWDMEWAQDHRWFSWDLSAVTDQQVGHDYPTTDSNNPFELRVSHNVTVRGKQTWSSSNTGIAGDMTSAVDNAMQWILDVFDSPDGGQSFGHAGLPTGLYYGIGNFYSVSGWNNLPIDSDFADPDDAPYFLPLDHMRMHSVNETDGTVTLNENWIVLAANPSITGSGNRLATEDFDVNLKADIDGITTITINGSIKGYEERNYGEPYDALMNPLIRGGSLGDHQQAYSNASGYFDEIQYRLFPRSQKIFQAYGQYGRLNPTPMDKSVAHNPSKGLITYNIVYNSRPCNLIAGSLSEDINIVDNNPSDVFASIVIPGRQVGPILQSIGTVTAATREVSVDIVVLPPTSCASLSELNINNPSSDVAGLLCLYEQELTSQYDVVMKNSDNQSWNPKTGRFHRAISWTYTNCSGSISTSVC